MTGAVVVTGATGTVVREVVRCLAAAARILSEELGRDIRYERPSALRCWREMRRHGHPTAYVNVMTALYAVSRLGLSAHLTGTTRMALGRAPISFRQCARDHASVWNGARERARPADVDAPRAQRRFQDLNHARHEGDGARRRDRGGVVPYIFGQGPAR